MRSSTCTSDEVCDRDLARPQRRTPRSHWTFVLECSCATSESAVQLVSSKRVLAPICRVSRNRLQHLYKRMARMDNSQWRTKNSSKPFQYVRAQRYVCQASTGARSLRSPERNQSLCTLANQKVANEQANLTRNHADSSSSVSERFPKSNISYQPQYREQISFLSREFQVKTLGLTSRIRPCLKRLFKGYIPKN